MMTLFEDTYIMNAFGHEREEQGKKLGILSTLCSMVRKGRITVTEAADEAGLTEEEFTAAMEAAN